jgi:hypothetical protein
MSASNNTDKFQSCYVLYYFNIFVNHIRSAFKRYPMTATFRDKLQHSLMWRKNKSIRLVNLFVVMVYWSSFIHSCLIAHSVWLSQQFYGAVSFLATHMVFIWDFHNNVSKNFQHLDCDKMSCRQIPTFQRNVMFVSSVLKSLPPWQWYLSTRLHSITTLKIKIRILYAFFTKQCLFVCFFNSMPHFLKFWWGYW